MKTQLELNYKLALENVEVSKTILKQAITELLENGKPCQKGDLVRIVKTSGETIEGIATTFGILRCEKVYVTTLKVGKKTIYISDVYKSIEIL
jgi:hypothetical protein